MNAGRYDAGTWRRIKNVHGTDAPAGGIGRMSDIETTTNALEITRPDGDDLENVVIIDSDIPAGGYGIGWESGTQPMAGVTGAPAVDDRVGSVTDSWLGAKSDTGTFIVRAVNGGTVFGFFRPSGAISREYITEFCTVDDQNPGSVVFGQPNNAKAQIAYQSAAPPAEYMVAAFKFANQLPSIVPNNPTLHLSDIHIHFYDRRNWVAIIPQTLKFYLVKIEEDFDPTTLTYNQYVALDKMLYAAPSFRQHLSSNALGFPAWIQSDIEDPGISTRWGITIAGIEVAHLFADVAGGSPDGAFGFAIEVDMDTAGVTVLTGYIQCVRTSTAAGNFEDRIDWDL